MDRSPFFMATHPTLEHHALDFFSDRTRDVTPPNLSSSLHVLYLPIVTSNDDIDRCRGLLAPNDLYQADAITADRARQQFIVRRAFQRFCAARAVGTDAPGALAPFTYTKNGQPHVADHPDISVSFSACAVGYLGAWSQRYNIGVDLEDRNRRVEPVGLAKRYFANTEVDLITHAKDEDQKTTFLKLWTLKEAALKSVGKGLAYGLEAFAFTLEPQIGVTKAPAEFGGADAFQVAVIANTDAAHAALVYHNPTPV